MGQESTGHSHLQLPPWLVQHLLWWLPSHQVSAWQPGVWWVPIGPNPIPKQWQLWQSSPWAPQKLEALHNFQRERSTLATTATRNPWLSAEVRLRRDSNTAVSWTSNFSEHSLPTLRQRLCEAEKSEQKRWCKPWTPQGGRVQGEIVLNMNITLSCSE